MKKPIGILAAVILAALLMTYNSTVRNYVKHAGHSPNATNTSSGGSANATGPARGNKTSQTSGKSGAVLAALNTLAVKGRGPLTGYSRAKFGAAWTDNNGDPLGHNRCDTRNDVLHRDLTAVTYKSGHCTIATGSLAEPYTGKTVHFVRGVKTSSLVQIDHVAAIGNVWVTGGAQITQTQRVNIANDPLELLAVDGSANEQKGDGDAATWLPSNKSFRCRYVAIQVAVKVKYHLWVTSAEKAAITKVLSSCPTEPMPTEPGGQ